MIRSNFSIQGDCWQLVCFYFIINLEFGVDFRDQLQLSSLPSVFYQQDVLESQICYCRTRNLKNTAQSDPSKFYAGVKVEIDVNNSCLHLIPMIFPKILKFRIENLNIQEFIYCKVKSLNVNKVNSYKATFILRATSTLRLELSCRSNTYYNGTNLIFLLMELIKKQKCLN
ncbi:Hypothetical_protein [Hexamita inflata]|uniref:Hypothetical_protein n=1 Tax=Hexamita inflata TaxID=28002 RepID=A0AA86TN19_9EUKA|nr:Hypothetical protein HINF_LOCUS9930 [Hexamita inflata]